MSGIQTTWWEPVIVDGRDRGLKVRNPETGELCWWRDVPIGATSSMAIDGSSFVPESWVNEDGLSIVVQCPGGHPVDGVDRGHTWHVDGQASNCNLKEGPAHWCWARHGDPRKAELTVDKNESLCSAGAGSIVTPHWHGFLRGGVLVGV